MVVRYNYVPNSAVVLGNSPGLGNVALAGQFLWLKTDVQRFLRFLTPLSFLPTLFGVKRARKLQQEAKRWNNDVFLHCFFFSPTKSSLCKYTWDRSPFGVLAVLTIRQIRSS